MRIIFLSIVCLNFIFLTAQSQTVKQICNHAWQETPASAIWNFEENGGFATILFWAGKKKFGYIVKKGKFTLDESTKTIKLDFDSTYKVYSKDSISINKDFGSQEWQLITFTDNKIVISRPPIWEFENKKTNYDNKNIMVTLVNSKKRKSALKRKE